MHLHSNTKLGEGESWRERKRHNGNLILVFIAMSLLQQNYLVSLTKMKGFTPPGYQQQLLH